MTKQLKILERFVEKGDFGDGHVVLSPGTTITDRKKFAESHLRALKGNKGNKTMLPYYERLSQFYKKMKNEN